MTGFASVRAANQRLAIREVLLYLPFIQNGQQLAAGELLLPFVYPNPSKNIVLIVDHATVNLRLARRVLESAGFEVCEATDAVSTFEVLKTCRPIMIVIDIQLPGMDGWELTRRLKRNFATQDIPIIVVTAFGTQADREYAIAAGCSEFVEKPISSTELPAIINRHLA